MKIRNLFLVFALTLAFLPRNAYAQKASVSFNAGDVLLLGTIGVEANYGFAQKWSVNAGMRYNPWTFNKGDAERQTQLRHQTYSAGLRYWPWYIYSSWFFGLKAQYQEYSFGGFGGKLPTEEGDAYGAGIEFGYSYLVSDHFNMMFGLGAWGGVANYRRYSCPVCGRPLGDGRKLFLWPNELIISFNYVF